MARPPVALAPVIVMRPTAHSCSIRDEGEQVVLILDGKATEMPPEKAIEIARGLMAKAQLIIERRPRVAERLAKDEAILLRAGVPLSLTSNPKIRAEAEKEAQHDRDLRRFMPGGVKSVEHVPGPVVSHVPPKGDSR